VDQPPRPAPGVRVPRQYTPEEMRALEQKVEEIERELDSRAPFSSDQLPDGERWRTKWEQELYDFQLQQGELIPHPPVAQNREAWVVLGPPGAGKSALANPIVADHEARIIDSDIVEGAYWARLP